VLLELAAQRLFARFVLHGSEIERALLRLRAHRGELFVELLFVLVPQIPIALVALDGRGLDRLLVALRPRRGDEAFEPRVPLRAHLRDPRGQILLGLLGRLPPGLHDRRLVVLLQRGQLLIERAPKLILELVQ
jgi:hypothetical protein